MKAQSSTLFLSYYLVPKIAQGVKLLDPIRRGEKLGLAGQTRLNPDYRMQVYSSVEGGVSSVKQLEKRWRKWSDAEIKLLLEI